MKTLDEVIEYFSNQCKMRHVYLTEDADARFADALHYLKEYRDEGINLGKLREQIEAYAEKRVQMEDILTDYVALKQYWAEQQENPSLTWNELKQMEGKPVWVEIVAPDNWKAWFLISAIDDGFLWVFDSKGDAHNLPRVCLDTRLWQAYRKERG